MTGLGVDVIYVDLLTIANLRQTNRDYSGRLGTTVETRKLIRGRPPRPNQRKEEHPHKSSYIHVATY